MQKIKDFNDLEVWQVGRQIRHAIYKLTSRFPPDEKFNLVAQMRRAATSMTSNIARILGDFHSKKIGDLV